MLNNFKFAWVWGTSAKHVPQRVGLSHELNDEDVMQIVIKTAGEQMQDKNYSTKIQQYYDKDHESKKKKKKLKT